ncbi:sensor histidine kinase [Cryptosporangium arvum]|uniref:histidine kinase n=1 Tax=Cryptosporangium arvum DSM 44712 TaxID=927661 RepID=A0A011ACP6_9ACTN|nr:histidine kinase [Cryptosporangium arvum]EXG79806.1 signal transduction histidine kinase [Cryptosporangium arvum DSM 44712]
MTTTECADPRSPWGRGHSPGLRVELPIAVGLTVIIGATLLGLPEAAHRLLVLDLVVAAVSVAMVPVMLRWPVPAAIALAVLTLVSPAATPSASAASMLVAQSRPFRLAALVGVGSVAAQAVQAAWRPTASLGYGWWLVLITVAWAALIGWGTVMRVRRELLISLQERARRAEADRDRRVAEARLAERTRIAREMHDVLAHRLTLLATYAGALEYRPDSAPEKLSAAAGVIRSGVREALEELRGVITVLREDESDDELRPQPSLADLDRLVGESRDAGTTVAFENDLAEVDADVPAATGRTVYRIVQEGLTNARKHAPGAPVTIVLTGAPGDGLRIELRNPVPVATTAEPLPGAGLGLLGLTERVQLARGELDHGIGPDGEFHLRVRIPWPA